MRLRTTMRPRISCTSFLTMARPRPEPTRDKRNRFRTTPTATGGAEKREGQTSVTGERLASFLARDGERRLRVRLEERHELVLRQARAGVLNLKQHVHRVRRVRCTHDAYAPTQTSRKLHTSRNVGELCTRVRGSGGASSMPISR